MKEFQLSRRQALLGSAALAGTASQMPVAPALAKAPFAKDQAPYFYRFKHGKMQGTVISDGILPLGEPSGSFLGTSKEEVGKMLTNNFLATDNVVLEQNILVLNTGDKLVLFDTGMGSSTMFGPTTGRMMQTLKGAGIDPKDIDAVVLSHAHVDHVSGLVDKSGKPVFANAQVYISQADFDFWTDEGKLGSPIKDFINFARASLLPVKDRLVFFKDGQEFLPGIQALAAPGHTVGHTIFVVTSSGKSVIVAADLAHHYVLLLDKPRTEFAYDTDPKAAAATRVKYFDMVAAQRLPIFAYHFPWPGLGHVAKAGEGYRYFASPVSTVL